MKRTLTAIVLALLLGGCAGGVGAVPSASPTASPTPIKPPMVIYELDGTATDANITIETPTGMSQQSVDVPLRNKSGSKGLRFTDFNYGAFLYISAQNDGEYGDLTCRIRVDGEVVSENTASGAYAIATCQARR
jgi:hypothetical protein